MNWLDISLLVLLGFAAFRGFQRGLIIELASVVGLVLGVWAGIHVSEEVTEWLGLEIKQEAIAFLVTFILVLVLVVILGRALTKLIDIAQLSLPNKLAGTLFALLRSAFVLSIALNSVNALRDEAWPTESARESSALYEPVLRFAPFVVPVLGSSKWIRRTWEEARNEADAVIQR